MFARSCVRMYLCVYLCVPACIEVHCGKDDKHPLKGSGSRWHLSEGTVLFLKCPPRFSIIQQAPFFFSLLLFDMTPTFTTSGLNSCSPPHPQKMHTIESVITRVLFIVFVCVHICFVCEYLYCIWMHVCS